MTDTVPVLAGNVRNCETLRHVYGDFDRLAGTAKDDIVLHPAVHDSHAGDRRGLPEVLEHERALLAATGGTLVMDVAQVVASDHFGAVLGILRATSPQPVAMPFCGLWRFEDGLLAEHWENAFDAAELTRLLQQPAAAR